MEDPLLIPLQGQRLKFDIRCYLLIAASSPSFMCFYHPGYCRLSLKEYSLSDASLADSSIHLTNAAIQKKEADYQERKELQIQSPQAIAHLLRDDGEIAAAEYFTKSLDADIKSCMKYVMKVLYSMLSLSFDGLFDLLHLGLSAKTKSTARLL